MKQRLQPALLLLALFGSLASAQTPGGRGDVPLGPPVQSTLPDLGSNANTVITKADEYQLGRMMMRDLRQENGYFDDPETTEYLQSVGSRIAVEAQDGGMAAISPSTRRLLTVMPYFRPNCSNARPFTI